MADFSGKRFLLNVSILRLIMCLAVPGKIISVQEEENFGLRRGTVDFGGIRKDVCLAYTPEGQTGDYVLVHVGFALTVIDEAEAQRVFMALCELGQLEELKEGMV
jgi:hydrogenase expression/formation protein HypC